MKDYMRAESHHHHKLRENQLERKRRKINFIFNK